MQPTTPPSTLAGFSQMTTILAFVANKPTHMGGAYRVK